MTYIYTDCRTVEAGKKMWSGVWSPSIQKVGMQYPSASKTSVAASEVAQNAKRWPTDLSRLFASWCEATS